MPNHTGKFLHTHLRTIAAILFGLIFSITVVHATPPGSPYTAGETLDPTCAPGDTNCSVTVFPDQTGNSGKFLTTNGTTTSWGTVTTYTFSTGLTNTANTVTNNLSTGVSGGQSVVGGTASGNNLTLSSTSHATKGKIVFGTSAYDEANSRLGIGTTSPATKLDLRVTAPQLATIQVTDGSNQYFTVNAVANDSVFIGVSAGSGATSAINSNFFGALAGQSATSASHSNFFGYSAGNAASSATYANFIGDLAGNGATSSGSSNFIGRQAGYLATTAPYSNFIGNGAGYTASAANNSNFIGNGAGYLAASAPYSNFIGEGAGNSAINATLSNFIGKYAGSSATNASYSNFIGNSAGNRATNAANSIMIGSYDEFYITFNGGATNAANSIFIGNNAGLSDTVNNTSGIKSSILIGDYTSTGGYSDSIAIGHAVKNNATGQLNIGNVLYGLGIYAGSNTSSSTPTTTGKIGIANNNPGELLTLGTTGTRLGVISFAGSTSGKVIVQPAAAAGSWTLTLPTDDGTSGYVLSTDGNGITSWIAQGSLAGSTSSLGTETWLGTSAGASGGSSTSTVFIGRSAGQSASGTDYSNFIGEESGYDADSSTSSNFFGYQAGYDADSLTYSNFIGYQAGYNADNSINSDFFGYQAGNGASNAQGSVFVGYSAGSGAATLSSAVFVGAGAGTNAGGASSSVFIGNAAGSGASNSTGVVFIGTSAGLGSSNTEHSVFIGSDAGHDIFGGGSSAHAIFIGYQSEYTVGTYAYNGNDPNDYSILIGNYTTTGGYSNSIALGEAATNTASNQFIIGSSTRGIDETRINGSAGTQCTITTGTGINCTSDERLKTNITDLGDDTLAKLRDIRTVTFNWRDNPSSNTQIGFIAQNLEPLFPELVATDPQGYKGVYYSQITPILVEAVKELDLKIESVLTLVEGTSETPSFADNLRAWFANAGNHITRIFTGEICLTDPDGTSECLNKQELGQLKQLLQPAPQELDGEGDTPPDDTGNTPPEETLPEDQPSTPPDDTPPPSDTSPESVDQ